jgi:CBS domain-containing protein
VHVTIADILRHKGRGVVTITQDRSVLDAVRVLVENNIGGLIVIDGDRPIGILTERDVLRLTARSAGQLESFTIGSVMTRDLVTATPAHHLQQAMTLMTERRIRHLPVLEDQALVGIVSIGDMVNACRSEAEEENGHLRGYIQGVPAEAVRH